MLSAVIFCFDGMLIDTFPPLGSSAAGGAVASLLRRLDERGARPAVVAPAGTNAAVMDGASGDPGVLVETAGCGPPDHGALLRAAGRLGIEPRSAAVVAGSPGVIEAGRRCGFGVVAGVGDGPGLWEAGADLVVSTVGDLTAEALLTPLPRPALEWIGQIVGCLGDRPAVFCDYDGTLSPIVDDPTEAVLPAGTRAALERLASRCPVGVISGRDLRDVRDMVGIEGIVYAGSHGFEIDGPGGLHLEHRDAQLVLPLLDRAEAALRRALAHLEGVQVERKRFAVAVHTRRAPSDDHRRTAVAEATRRASDRLALVTGKEVAELRPALPWGKGRAVEYVLDALGGGFVPLYLGDDTTDEDAFEVLRSTRSVTVRVGGGPTSARYLVGDPAEARRLLEILCDRL